MHSYGGVKRKNVISSTIVNSLIDTFSCDYLITREFSYDF